MPDYLPAADAELSEWLSRFLQAAQANLNTLGLRPHDLDTLVADQRRLGEAFEDVRDKQAALEAAIQSKRYCKQRMVASIRTTVRKIQANPDVPRAVKIELGLSVRGAHAASALPVPPKELRVRGLDIGVNVLTWERDGNKIGTQFVVEARGGAAQHWFLVDVVTATRFRHGGQQPGVRIAYRVRARRGNHTSDSSNEAVVYGDRVG